MSRENWRKLPLEHKQRLLHKLKAGNATLGVYEKPTLAMQPHPRQAEFLALDCEEALFGGAAGGGKSESLLMWLAEGINIPGYAAVIFRRTYPQLAKADGLIPKSRLMYGPLGGLFVQQTKTWRFPSGASIELGHLQYDADVQNYTGAAFDRIAFDELTQFSERQYRYLFSRLGRTEKGIKPGVRSASNPDGIGRQWVKNRFVSQEAIEAIKGLPTRSPTPAGMLFWMQDSEGKRAFVPSRVADNPSLTVEEYSRRLATYLDPITRERLLNGDWSITQEGRIREHWLRFYTMQGDYYHLHNPHSGKYDLIHQAKCTRISVVDCAATSEEVVRREKMKPPSFSVVSVFDITPDHRYIWRDIRRGLWDFPELLSNVQTSWNNWQPAWIGIEDEKTGRALWQMLDRSNFNVRPLSTEGKDKLTRAAEMLNIMEQGRFYIPQQAPWRKDLMDELLPWTGHPDEQSDQIDTAAYAVREWQRGEFGREMVIEPILGIGGYHGDDRIVIGF